MSFFPTADPEKLRAAMAQEHAFYNITHALSPSQHSHNGNDDDDFSDDSAWSTIVTSTQESYSASPALAWSSQPQGLGLDSLPTPTQSMFDQAYHSTGSYDVSTSWAPSTSTQSSSNVFPAYTTPEAVSSAGYPFATPLSTTGSWDGMQSSTSSFVPAAYDSPPARSDYSTGSQQSVVGSSPYAHSDTCFQLSSLPFIKIEDTAEHQRPRLYSVPGLVSLTQPSHVNPGDVYSSPPLTATKRHAAGSFHEAGKTESEDVKHFLRPQRPQSRRAISEESMAESRQKRGYTTQANSTCHCQQCGKLFQRSYNLKAHMETHDPHRDQPHACSYVGCKRRFVRRTDLIRHEQSVHLKERKYQCPLCYSSFARKDTLRRHIDDGCPRRPEVKKRMDRTHYTLEFSPPMSGRRSSQQFDHVYMPKVEQYP